MGKKRASCQEQISHWKEKKQKSVRTTNRPTTLLFLPSIHNGESFSSHHSLHPSLARPVVERRNAESSEENQGRRIYPSRNIGRGQHIPVCVIHPHAWEMTAEQGDVLALINWDRSMTEHPSDGEMNGRSNSRLKGWVKRRQVHPVTEIHARACWNNHALSTRSSGGRASGWQCSACPPARPRAA